MSSLIDADESSQQNERKGAELGLSVQNQMTAMQRHQIDQMQYMGNVNQQFINEMDLQCLQMQQLTSGQGAGQMNSQGRQTQQLQANQNEGRLGGNQSSKANPQ